jgi:hypothetical protein
MLDHPALSNVKVICSEASITKDSLLESDQTFIYVPFKTDCSNHLYIHVEHIVEDQELTAGIAIHYDHDQQAAHLVLMPLDVSDGSPLTAFSLSLHDDLERMAAFYCKHFIAGIEQMDVNDY